MSTSTSAEDLATLDVTAPGRCRGTRRARTRLWRANQRLFAQGKDSTFCRQWCARSGWGVFPVSSFQVSRISQQTSDPRGVESILSNRLAVPNCGERG